MSRQSRSGGGGGSGAPPLDSKSRQNEFFVHREGIDRDVITADICAYLGNDALVKPGVWRDDKGVEHPGYFVTAYRNLTTAMIDDLKADSARWEQERRKHQNSAVRYEGSSLQHHNRSQPGYSGGGQARPMYDSMSGYQGGSYQGGTGGQAYPSGYGGSSGYPAGAGGSYPSQAYPSTASGYSGTGMDPRGSYPTSGMATGMSGMPSGAPQGYGGMGASRPTATAAYAVQQDYDSPMQDVGAGQAGYGGAPRYPPQQAGAYQQYQQGAGPGQGYPQGTQMTQPVDLYYGRGPGGAYPVGSSAAPAYPEGAAAPAAGMPYSPADQYDASVSRASAASPGAPAQVSSSGPSDRRDRNSEYREHRGDYRESRERDRRDRGDREDRHTEKRQHRR